MLENPVECQARSVDGYPSRHHPLLACADGNSPASVSEVRTDPRVSAVCRYPLVSFGVVNVN